MTTDAMHQRFRTVCASVCSTLLALLPGCVGEIGDAAIGGPGGGATEKATLAAPSRVQFEAVAKAMQPSCGTLDCHGQVGRNLRLYGGRGLRLDPKANPADGDTTPEEFDASYWSLLSLEPETLSAVIRDGGAYPERLSLIRKGRGTERHKGGTLMKAGDDLDRCITTWLTGAVNAPACAKAAMIENPIPPMTAN